MADIQYSEGGNAYYGAEYSYQEQVAPAPNQISNQIAALPVSKWASWAGAGLSVALIGAMGVWGWQLLMRDVSDIPVIEAFEGPMRVAPDNPGGAIAPNQGLSVNRLAEGQEAAPVPNELVIAPPPMELVTIDQSALLPEQAFDSASAASVRPSQQASGIDAQTALLIDQVIAEAAGEPVEFGPATPQSQSGTNELVLNVAPAVIPETVPGVVRSLRPLTRPNGFEAQVAAANAARAVPQPAPEQVAPEPQVMELASSDLPDGTRLVQLGAFDSPDLARSEWTRLSQIYPEYFQGRARVIEQATSAGTTFYRLRAHGFDDLNASRQFCASLVALGAACIPVTVR